MNWADRLIDPLRYLPGNLATFRTLVEALMAEQQVTWPELGRAIAALQEVEYRRCRVRGSEVLLQHNPKRIASTTANVDAIAIKQRPCFLCSANMPVAERGIAFGSRFILVCNPFPVLRNHVVVLSLEHVPQQIDWEAFLSLAQLLGEGYAVLYNGPACGASAPDHMHFQAAASDLLPILKEIDGWPKEKLYSSMDVEAFRLLDYRLNIIIAQAQSRDSLRSWLMWVVEVLLELDSDKLAEPMMNVLVHVKAKVLRVILFPRAKHRPSHFYAKSQQRLTISPAAIDLAGVVVVPENEHFLRVDAEALVEIFDEVMIADNKLAELVDRLGGASC